MCLCLVLQASQFQLRLQKEGEAREAEKKAKEAAAANKRTVTEDDYAQLVDVWPVSPSPPFQPPFANPCVTLSIWMMPSQI